ncbi:MAG: zinc carboxypeptidase, partial [Cyclobacteriaceae bacterium]|nr:zinc carboxypeptidase [Cyclobacteriaceae bacterium]
GGLGLVFEQASSRGHVQRSTTKDVTFAFTIRNHVRTSLATVKAAVENRERMLKHQQEFFRSALDEGKKSSIKGYVFGDSKDAGRTRAFAELLLKHRIETYPLTADLTLGSNRYEKGKTFVVPTDQTQYRMVRSVFEKVTQFYDSVFYDASTWTMALAYNMPHDALSATVKVSKGEKLKLEDLKPAVAPVTKSTYAYLIDWSDYNAARLLYKLQLAKIFVKSAFKPFAANVSGAKRNFGFGTLIIAVADQNLTADDLFEKIKDASAAVGVDVHSVSTGFSVEGIDLGSNNVRTVAVPKVVMLVGDGAAATDAGALWYLMDSQLQLPMTKVNSSQFGQLKLSEYNTLIMVAGNYTGLGETGVTKIKTWVQQGGTLLLFKTAVSWAINNKLIDEQLKKEEEKKETKRLDYVTAADYTGSRAIGGSIYQGNLDITHPLGFGYTNRDLPVWRNHSVFIEAPKNPFNQVIKYSAKPLLSGYVHPSNLEKIKNSTSLAVSTMGQGRAILFLDDPAFRGYWYGTNKLFFNALFLGSAITTPSFEGAEE